MRSKASLSVVMARRALAVAAFAMPSSAQASALEVTPILTDVVGEADGATSISIRNRAATPATVQLRLLRWTLQDGQDRLEPTMDTAVSPPFATIQPGATHVVRLVRLSKRSIVGEEAYRLLLDELPSPGGDQVAITLAVRHALPVFFRSPKARAPAVLWSIREGGGGRELVAVNTGERRVRVARLQLRDGAGDTLDFGGGLAGYALGGGERRWRLPTDKPFRPTRVTVSFVGETGPVTADVSFASAPPA